MMTHPSPMSIVQRVGIAGLALMLVGCASDGATQGSGNTLPGFNQVTLAPGDTGHCDSMPCTVYLEMPPGTGTYEVTGNDSRIGDYPAGETVNLGSFRSNQTFAITGKNTLVAELYIRNP